MANLLAVGLPVATTRWLEQRIPGLSVSLASEAETAARRLREQTWSLLLLEYQTLGPQTAGMATPALLAMVKALPATTRPVVICLLDPSLGRGLASQLVNEDGVGQILFQPVDREELAYQVASALGVGLSPSRATTDATQQQAAAAVAALWARFRETNLGRVALVEEASTALRNDVLTPELRRKAGCEAHKLAGAVGSFGFQRGSALAREIEQMLQPSAPLGPGDAGRLAELAATLRAELGRRPSLPTRLSEVVSPAAFLLIVDDDRDLGERLALAASERGLRAEAVVSLSAARDVMARTRPDAVLLDLSLPDSTEDSLAFLGELAALVPPVPVMVLTARDDFADRVEVARRGGRGFLSKSLPAGRVIEVLCQMLGRLQADDSRILAVDDDPQVLATLRAVLASRGLELATLDDPLRFWETLAEVAPDLLVLDVDMPHLSGIELCRVVRNDPRWVSVPVLFLTGRTDAETVHRVFAAGADDYVTKPVIGPEVVSRIVNRLERTRLYRQMAETDFLTGVANARRASQVLERLLTLATRRNEPLALAVVDLDHFKQVNDLHGHVAGDAVLRRVGELLLSRFRGSDLVARWGGEEFLLAMYGMTRASGAQRLVEALAALREEQFRDADGLPFRVTFSAGVSQFPNDGADLFSLFRAADAALYQAKAGGRDRVVAGYFTSSSRRAASASG